MKTPLLFLVLAFLTILRVDAADGGYLFVHFKGESSPMTEQIYFGLSPDGKTWENVNKGEPVLVSALGEKGVRDPFILRSPDGKKAFIIATDLSINLNNSFTRAMNSGSKSIVIWESDDLVKWSEPRLVQVSPDDAGCTWAPEAIWDDETNDYLVYWASKNRRDKLAKQRIWAARTKDFKTFGEPFIYIDKENDTIDTTIVRENGVYYRFSKDEKSKAILMETSPKLLGPWQEKPDFSLKDLRGYEGPTCFVTTPAFAGQPARWNLLLDYYSRGEGYQTFSTSNLASGKFTADPGSKFPYRFRHGAVLPVTEAEYARLKTISASNPIASAPVDPKQIVPQRADPQVFLHTDGYYYFTASSPEYDRIEVRRVKSLLDLGKTPGQVVWRKHDRGEMSSFVWAPEIHFIDGKWYIYFSASKGGIGNVRPFVLENPSPNPLEGTWTEKGQIKMDWDSFTLDATTFVNHGGRYLAWAQAAPGRKGTGVFIAKMDTPTTIVSPQVELTWPEFPWEMQGPHVNEGPAVIQKNGRVFMTFSASRTDQTYCLGLLTAKDGSNLLDNTSWKKEPIPIFKSNPAMSEFGPGHNCFTTTPDKRTDLIVYHARSYEKIVGEPLYNPDRGVYIKPVRWKPDGTIDLGLPGEGNLVPQ